MNCIFIGGGAAGGSTGFTLGGAKPTGLAVPTTTTAGTGITFGGG